jgi:hypothetical protein
MVTRTGTGWAIAGPTRLRTSALHRMIFRMMNLFASL